MARIVTSLALLLTICASAWSQQVPGLTPDDYIEIQQLVNRLNFALDYCGRGGSDFADLFIEGGKFIIDQGDGKPIIKSTRSELIELAGGPDCKSRMQPPSGYILHLAESLVIEATAEGAHGMSYAIYPPSHGKRFSDNVEGQLGVYHDEYVRTPAGWRFKTRRHEVNPVPGKIDL